VSRKRLRHPMRYRAQTGPVPYVKSVASICNSVQQLCSRLQAGLLHNRE